MNGFNGRYSNLLKQISKRQPRTLMEVGTWNGVHGSRMLKYARQYKKNAIYYGFDLFEDMTPETAHKELNPKKVITRQDVVKQFAEEGFILNVDYHLIQGVTKETLPRFIASSRSLKEVMDFIFIDGGHSLETIAEDLENCSKVADKDTCFLMDDYYSNREDFGAKAVIEFYTANEGYTFKLLEPMDEVDNPELGKLQVNIIKVGLPK